MITASLLIITFLLTLFYYKVYWRREARLINCISGPRIYPLVGNIPTTLGTPEKFWKTVRELNNIYYPIFRLWNGIHPSVNIRHPDHVEVVLSSTKHIEKSIFYNFLQPWLGTGLLTSTGKKWQTRRKILTPAFHFNVLQQFADILIVESEKMINHLTSIKEETLIDLVPLISEYTLNMICETAMGTSLEGKGEFQCEYRKAIYEMGGMVVYRTMRPWVFKDSIFSITPKGKQQKKALNILHGFTEKIISERKIYHEETGGKYLNSFHKQNDIDDTNKVTGMGKKKLAMLDLLIAASRNGGQIDDLGIREEVDTFMFEGHDTTAMGLCFLLLLLAENKSCQDRVQAEVDAVLEEDGKMTMSTLQKLTYLERCIKESLRLYPSVPFISRQIREEFKMGEYTVPAGTLCHIHIYDLHRDPNFWPNPMVFDPDRFLSERIQGRHPYSYIPFSAGPRNCIGQRFAMLELKAITAHILHKFYIEPVEKLDQVKMLVDLVLRPAQKLYIKLVPRESS